MPGGTRLGRYEILSLLGSGSMGEVYRARDNRLGREVAVKVLPQALASDPERLVRFEREVRVASALSDPHIVTVFDAGCEESIPYFVSELVEGETLRAVLATRTLRHPDAGIRLLGAVALGQFGPHAEKVLPILERMKLDPDKDVREAAGEAIERVKGK